MRWFLALSRWHLLDCYFAFHYSRCFSNEPSEIFDLGRAQFRLGIRAVSGGALVNRMADILRMSALWVFARRGLWVPERKIDACSSFFGAHVMTFDHADVRTSRKWDWLLWRTILEMEFVCVFGALGGVRLVHSMVNFDSFAESKHASSELMFAIRLFYWKRYRQNIWGIRSFNTSF